MGQRPFVRTNEKERPQSGAFFFASVAYWLAEASPSFRLCAVQLTVGSCDGIFLLFERVLYLRAQSAGVQPARNTLVVAARHVIEEFKSVLAASGK